MNQSQKGIVFRIAWSLNKKGQFPDFSRALKAAWRRFRLIKDLRSGGVFIMYLTDTGRRRSGMITLEPSRIGKDSKIDGYSISEDSVHCWDMMSSSCISFSVENLIG